MFASAHFRRERFEPGRSDGAGSPGACPAQAAAPLVCCMRTLRAGAGPATLEQDASAAASWLLPQSSYVFLKGTISMIPDRNILLHFSILGEVISVSIELC